MAAGEEKIMFPSGGSSTICDQQVISWQNHFQQGTLAQALRSHWKKQVPLICSPLYLPGNQPLEEDETRKSLLFPLELFICGGEPQEVFSQLKNLDNPRQLCGKVFKVGEPTYSCRDCGMDPTCVLCIECFQKSTHKTHRYKMSTSGGGGYCDCGDEEAWRGHPFCDIHQVGAVADEDQDPILVLPEGLRLRTEAVLMCAVPYILQIICWQDLETLPADLEPENKEDTYCCMLYNDEVHTYDQVIKSLNRALDCTQKEAVDFATTVDRERGRR
ncbi:PREDICTED: E3 ubiquitin-protein ligase UBR2-like [Priapulus caudatus]|uniref:E3 ubiquitin-protein ligase n=1 Tax=Priapulus caudatus TaxID=37621 RepID=A0ABM1DY38_PRICU|nr:PREDICTED: E3 ubiquitin-protein ligase UBR2-like [Priapulus caudatus]